MNRRLRHTWLAFPLTVFLVGCSAEETPELRFVAYGVEPAWTIHVWSDTLTLQVEGDHGAHRFAVPPAIAGASSFETSAGELELRLEIDEAACTVAGGDGRETRLSFADRSFAGCAREPALAIVATGDPAGTWASAAPAGWSRADESRGDTIAIAWSAPGGDAELAVLSLPLTGGYEQDGLLELAESFVRARYPGLAPDRDRALARPPNGVRLPFGATSAGTRERAVVDIEQEPGRLRLIALRGAADAAAWEEESLLLGAFRWLTRADPPPDSQPPVTES